MNRSLERPLLWSRLLTRSGDQAWDFALPLALLQVYPGRMEIAAISYFLLKAALMLGAPALLSLIDQHRRLTLVRWGIGVQAVAVAALAIFLSLLSRHAWPLVGVIALVTLLAWLSHVGALIIETAVATDWVPALIAAERLPVVNSRLRQLDLATEVSSPILAGILLALSFPRFPLLGFWLVALWNLISFGPELFLLTKILRERPDLNQARLRSRARSDGWSALTQEPVALPALAYGFLWFSVLSPHGVLLTTFLKAAWKMPETWLALFRASGAVVGLSATLIFPRLLRRWGLYPSALFFICFQALTLLFALPAFAASGRMLGQMAFLLAILLSRIGLYGFSLGELQIRQMLIAPERRGRVNGWVFSLCSFFHLGILGLGALCATPEKFFVAVAASVFSVQLGALCFCLWKRLRPDLIANLNGR